ncbi:MAG: TIGR03619 family F420-dependent LLM class oxidoreductase [Actinobacteria bacterium]|nr:TIGR03619 family F420-dependent LLM class oxidoreductase [Actinomycetota bacterium]MCB9388650.1 TIGR03619 family F420-dependent LLM class oxidoreductase [Acidimicrobiia bacterium]
MRLGVTIFATDQTMPISDLAREAEDRGFWSLYLPEHTHIPVARTTPAPLGEPLPEEYKRTLDPFVALAMAGAVTDKIHLGTGIALLAQRDPIITAKSIATLHAGTEGRFTFGVGYGWNVDEMEDHGVNYATRREIVAEKMALMRSLWRDEIAEFDGDYVSLAPSWAWPKPLDGGPRVLLGGGAGPKLFGQIASWADGWIPVGGSGLTHAVAEMRAAAERAGRDPDELDVVPFGSEPTGGKLDHFERNGVTECVFRLPSAGRDEVLAVLDSYVPFLDRYPAE